MLTWRGYERSYYWSADTDGCIAVSPTYMLANALALDFTGVVFHVSTRIILHRYWTVNWDAWDAYLWCQLVLPRE